MKYLIKKILKEETEHLDVIHIPSFKYFNNDWNFLQEYMESEGNPPYTIDDDFYLYGTKIKSLGNLLSVDGDLYLRYVEIESLGNLQSIGGGLVLFESNIKSIGNLRSVGHDMNLEETEVQSLGNLQFVGGNLFLRKTQISKKHSKEEIRQMVQVGGNIYM
jgi:hypothetical protein